MTKFERSPPPKKKKNNLCLFSSLLSCFPIILWSLFNVYSMHPSTFPASPLMGPRKAQPLYQFFAKGTVPLYPTLPKLRSAHTLLLLAFIVCWMVEIYYIYIYLRRCLCNMKIPTQTENHCNDLCLVFPAFRSRLGGHRYIIQSHLKIVDTWYTIYIIIQNICMVKIHKTKNWSTWCISYVLHEYIHM